MKIIIHVIIIAACFLLLSKTKISFQPFKISLESWPFAVGFFLILMGIGFIQYESDRKGQKKGIETTLTTLKKIVEEEKANHE